MKLSLFLKREAIVFVVMILVFTVSQIASWGWWLWKWGDLGHMPDAQMYGLQFLGISIIATSITFVAGTIISLAAEPPGTRSNW